MVHTGEHNNQYVSIYTDRVTQCASRLLEHVLDCAEVRTFWVEWSNNMVRVGAGHVAGVGLITNCSVSRLQVSGVSVASSMGQEGYWQFEDVTSSEWVFNVVISSVYDHLYMKLHRQIYIAYMSIQLAVSRHFYNV